MGDLTNYGVEDELKEIYDIIHKFNKPFIHVIGNHDCYGLPKNEMLKITKQKRYHAIHNEDASLIFLDTAKDQDFEDWGGTLEETQLQWLDKQLELAKTNPVLVFAHHPVYETTSNSEKKGLSVDPNIPLKDILNKKQGVNIYINGHNHYNSIVQQGNWTYVQLSAVMDEIGARIIEISEQQIEIKEITLSNEILKSAANKVGTAIDHFELSPHQIGVEKDRNVTLLTNEKVKA
ncbi:metallophosphoesterase family protein [Lysinibacillus telephonicus]|uniref:metallophosphoesterase family protein n=1 Tax=Lysinibacillus telephonicus TaxID=1714840 RepID=UPI0037D3F9ED